MTEKVKSSRIYRPYILDFEKEIRKEVDEIRKKYRIINKQGLERMIFRAGIPIVKKNLAAVNLETGD